MITKPHPNYRMPSSWMVKKTVQEIAGKKINFDEDLYLHVANIISNYYVTGSIETAFVKTAKNSQAYKVLKQLFDGIDLGKYKGTPLEKAVTIVLQVQSHCEYNSPEKWEKQGCIQCMSRSNEKSIDEMAEAMSKSIEEFQDGESLDSKTELQTGNQEQEEKGEYEDESVKIEDWVSGRGGKDLGIRWVMDGRIIKDMVELDDESIQTLENGILLKNMTKMRTGSKIFRKFDPKSKKKKIQRISNYNQIAKVPVFNRLLPGFDIRYYAKSVPVRDGMRTIREKQRSYILVDKSGSMDCVPKRAWRNAIVKKMCQDVIDGKREFIYSHYVNTIMDTVTIATPEEAEKFYKKIRRLRPTGGNTNIARILQITIDKLVSTELVHGRNPELTIVMDGQDAFKASSVDPKGVKVNAFILGAKHTELEKFCLRTGGAVIQKNFVY